MGTLDIFKKFHQETHEGRVDKSVCDIGVENDGFEVYEYVQFVVDGATRRHSIIHFMQMPFYGLRFNRRRDLVGAHWSEGEGVSCEHQLGRLLDILITYNRLYRSVRVMDEELVDRFQRDFRLLGLTTLLQSQLTF